MGFSCFINILGWLTFILILIASSYNLYLYFKRRKLLPGTFRGKVVVITGASSGIGKALALKYAEYGASLVLAARREDRLAELKQDCETILRDKVKDLTARVITVRVDVTVPAECRNLIDTAVVTFNTIDVLVLNAGISGGKIPFADWENFSHPRKVMDTNYWGSVYPLFYALPTLRKVKKERGYKASVVVVSSLAGQTGTPLRTAYAPSKFALHGFEQSVRHEEYESLNVTAICPGYVITEMHEKELARFNLKRNSSQFMTAEKCAEIMIDAQLNGDRLLLMTFSGTLLGTLRPFIPGHLMDRIVASSSNSAFLAEGEDLPEQKKSS